MIVAVFAGTKVDTNMGDKILKKEGFKTLKYSMSENSKEQRNMQYYSKKDLEKTFIKKAKDAINKGAEKIFIYCNSLSSAIDYEKISKLLDIKIITPLEVYKNLDRNYKNIAILAANGISAYRIDQIISNLDFVKNTISIGNMSIVEKIEEGLSPRDIIKKLNLSGFLNYLENIEEYKIDILLLGCTHFPYLKEELEKITSLKILDPKDEMIQSLREK